MRKEEIISEIRPDIDTEEIKKDLLAGKSWFVKLLISGFLQPLIENIIDKIIEAVAKKFNLTKKY